MDEKRMQALADYLSKDSDRTERLFEMGVETAMKEINSDGFDFTVQELQTFAEAVIRVGKKSETELNAEELDDVSGGMLVTFPGALTFWVAKNVVKWLRK